MTTKELCRQAGVTLREAQWWSEGGILKPAFIEGSRSFDEEEVLVAAIVVELRKKGVPLQKIRRMRLRGAHGDFLVVNGASRLWCRREEVITAVTRADGPCLVVCVEDLRKRLYA
jgi:DNA-binding transcriptional MerR regulator